MDLDLSQSGWVYSTDLVYPYNLQLEIKIQKLRSFGSVALDLFVIVAVLLFFLKRKISAGGGLC